MQSIASIGWNIFVGLFVFAAQRRLRSDQTIMLLPKPAFELLHRQICVVFASAGHIGRGILFKIPSFLI